MSRAQGKLFTFFVLDFRAYHHRCEPHSPSYAKPYDDASLNAMELGTLFASATAILSAVVLTLQPIDWTLDSSINKPTLAVFTGSIAVPAAVLMLLLAQEVILGFLGSSTAESASSTVEESTVKDVGVQTAGT